MPIPPDLQIFYPNGGTQASQMYIWSGGAPVAWDGSISVSTSGSAIEDGVTSTIKATVIDLLTGGGASNPLAVAIVDTTGAQIASFGGGTQYVEGVTTSPATGTVFLWRKSGGNLVAVDATNKLPVVGPLTDTELRATAVPISAASLPLPSGAATEATLSSLDGKDFATQTTLAALNTKIPSQGQAAMAASVPVVIASNQTAVPVSGPLTDTELRATAVPVTANAGTNLNTSALALESGGNLAAAAASLSVMDDWDETDRAKVNIIAGQAGITAGAGAVAASTPRMTLASDDPAVAVLGTTGGTKVITDAAGSIQQYLRGLIFEAIQTRNLKLAYNASSSITVTNLQSLATSATWVAGWESGAIDNSSNLFCDYAINADIVVGAAPTAGEIRMYLVAEMDDSTWPDVFDGTESTETVSDTQTRDAICRLAAITVTDATASQHWYLMCPSVAQVFGGWVPRKFVVFITHSTVQNLAAAGNAVYVRGAYYTVA